MKLCIKIHRFKPLCDQLEAYIYEVDKRVGVDQRQKLTVNKTNT